MEARDVIMRKSRQLRRRLARHYLIRRLTHRSVEAQISSVASLPMLMECPP